MARLDRLGSAKEIAQVGAAIGREFSHSLLAAVAHKNEVELGSALEKVVEAGLLFRRGVAPQSTYIFKHALVQDAAYGTLLRAPRQALHARIAAALESHFAEIVEGRPELLAHHCTEAGLNEKAAILWGKAGQRSLGLSALKEAVAQLSRALALIEALPGTSALRREQVRLQLALANALMHVKGYAAPETKTSLHQARLYIERAEAFGEPLEDPLALFSVLYGFWVANLTSFDGDAARELAMEFLTLAERQGSTVPRMIGHRLMGRSLIDTGNIVDGCRHCDQALALYDPEHRWSTFRIDATRQQGGTNMIDDGYFAELSDAEDGVAVYFDNELIEASSDQEAIGKARDWAASHRLGVVAMLTVKQGFRGVHSRKIYLGA
jgi:hypothetical protein